MKEMGAKKSERYGMTGYERIQRYRMRKVAQGQQRVDIFLPPDAWLLLDEMGGTRSEAITDSIRCSARLYTPEWEEVFLLFRQGKIRAVR